MWIALGDYLGSETLTRATLPLYLRIQSTASFLYHAPRHTPPALLQSTPKMAQDTVSRRDREDHFRFLDLPAGGRDPLQASF